jgi:hypothetical protein
VFQNHPFAKDVKRETIQGANGKIGLLPFKNLPQAFLPGGRQRLQRKNHKLNLLRQQKLS